MALLKLSELVTSASGKIGGQSISNTRNGVMIKNIGQPKKQPTPKQSIKRQETAVLTNAWQFLTAPQKTSYEDTAHNYEVTDSNGITRTRNGFQTFCFLNQNLKTLDLPLMETAPTYAPITNPIITNISTGTNDFIVQGSNLVSNYTYVVFCQIHFSLGASTIQNKPIIINQLTYAELLSGYDLKPSIEENFEIAGRSYRATVKIYAIDRDTGNRTLEVEVLSNNIVPVTLTLNPLAYFPFNNNTTDYFSNVPNIPDGIDYETNGVVDKSAVFEVPSLSNIITFPPSTLDFGGYSGDIPFSAVMWLYPYDDGPCYVLSKREGTSSFDDAQYLVYYEDFKVIVRIYDARNSNYKEYESADIYFSFEWHFIGLSYSGAGNLLVVVNEDVIPLTATGGSFTRMRPSDAYTMFGVQSNFSGLSFNGELCEVYFDYDSLSYDDLQEIRTTNLSGQSILTLI